jgi:Tfp pilus assembly protein PilP
MKTVSHLRWLLLVCCAIFLYPTCEARQLFALEKYPVKSLKVFDTVWSEKRGTYYAFVLDPEGYAHHVETKEHLGKIGEGGGLVTNITRCAIHYDALISDGSGGWNVVPSVLAIEPNSDLFVRKHCASK